MSEERGSNPRPSAWEADVLPTELSSLIWLLKVVLYGYYSLEIFKAGNMAYRSRLKRHKNKQAMRQSVVYGILSIIFVLGMVKWGVPALVRVVSYSKGGSGQITKDKGDMVPPQAPVITNSVPEATFSASIRIAGKAPLDTSVKLVVNGDDKGETKVDDAENFEFGSVNLSEGENVILLTSIDKDGLESNQVRLEVKRDDTAPEVEILSPGEDSEVFGRENQNVVIEGKASESDINVWVNGHIVVDVSGENFKYRTRLNEGMNEFNVEVEDRAGNKATKLVRINFGL